ncbi:unnamed protein product [Toxocara canis]|uniref:Exocyst complex component 6 n=1 Tax=Toxocara canis TaxID=6265 RepID=A0A183UXB8_TOXCA|nr:unnamed protein product [Toxocara canis]
MKRFLANYDWELSSSSGRASDYISDLIKFLETTFLSFTNLPALLARHVCMQICKYLANRLSDLLLSPDLKAVSTGALDQFDLDVIQCELFTSQCPVAGLEDATLAMTFASLRQLLDLVMKADWPTYLADYGKEESKYSRVKASSAITVLEKYDVLNFLTLRADGAVHFNRGKRRKNCVTDRVHINDRVRAEIVQLLREGSREGPQKAAGYDCSTVESACQPVITLLLCYLV